MKILYIEDDYTLARYLQKRLSKEGYEVAIEMDGESGIKRVRSEKFELLLVDYLLPGLSGLEVMKILSEEECLPPTIMVTGKSDFNLAVEVMKVGAADYIGKENTQFFDFLINAIEKIIEQQKIIKKKLEEERFQRLAVTVFNSVSEAIVILNEQKMIQAINPTFTRITGYEEHEVLGKEPLDLIMSEKNQILIEEIWTAIRNNDFWEGETKNKTKSGQYYPARVLVNAVKNETNEVMKKSEFIVNQYVIVFNDITIRKKHELEIWKQANYDPLTKLANRKLFMDRIERSLNRSKRNNTSAAILFIDLDHFKWVNDTLGHSAGDKLLVMVAERITRCVRETDTVARLGGDEFTVILSDLLSNTTVEQVAKKILENLFRPFYLSKNKETHISGSIGIAMYPNDADDVGSLLNNADTAMYRAKEHGRNAIEFFTQKMNEQALEEMNKEKEIRTALCEHQFMLYYQPVVNLRSKKWISVEALIRWNHPSGEIFLPKDFLPYAKKSGAVIPIGQWVFQQAIEDASILSKEFNISFPVAINIASRQCLNVACDRDLMSILKNKELAPEMLTWEISENLITANKNEVVTLLERVKKLGITLAVDDYGSGFSSLIQLLNFPIDIIKIHKDLIQDLESELNDGRIVDAIVAMAHRLGAKVTAEGVETASQEQFLREIGCDYAQGYLYNQPMPFEQFLEQLKQQRSEV